jgi:hypothetical protein
MVEHTEIEMKITVYEFVNENRQQYRELARVGIVSGLLERDLQLYEMFQRELTETQSRMQATSRAAESFKISERQVITIVKKYDGEITQI